MSIYDNETKFYPDLNPSATQESQAYCLNKLSETEAFFLDEIEVREQIAKKKKMIQYNHRYRRHSLITSTMITGGISIAAFASRVGLPVGITLSGTSLSIATAITQKSF